MVWMGLSVLAATVALFYFLRPRNGKLSPIIGTPWEPYIAVLLVLGFALGLGMTLVPLVGLFI